MFRVLPSHRLRWSSPKGGAFSVPAIKQVRFLYVPLMFSTKIKQRRY